MRVWLTGKTEEKMKIVEGNDKIQQLGTEQNRDEFNTVSELPEIKAKDSYRERGMRELCFAGSDV